MAYDEGLAERIRSVLDEQPGVSEKRMFGGIAFLVKGRMSVGIVQDKLMVRVGPESYDRILRERHARKMDFTGKPMKGFIYVIPSGYETDADLQRWVGLGVGYVTSLPAKPSSRKGGAPNRRTKTLKTLIARVALLALGLSTAAVRSSPEECGSTLSAADAQAVRAVQDAYRASWLRGDPKGVLATLTDDAVLLPAHGAPPVRGKEAITQYWWPPNAPSTTITRLDITVAEIDGDCRIAFTHGEDHVGWSTVEDGKVGTHGHPGTYLNVLVKGADGRWRIARHMWDDGPGQ